MVSDKSRVRRLPHQAQILRSLKKLVGTAGCPKKIVVRPCSSQRSLVLKLSRKSCQRGRLTHAYPPAADLHGPEKTAGAGGTLRENACDQFNPSPKCCSEKKRVGNAPRAPALLQSAAAIRSSRRMRSVPVLALREWPVRII